MVLPHPHTVTYPAWRVDDMRWESPKSSIILDRDVAEHTVPQTIHDGVSWHVTCPPKVRWCPEWPAGGPIIFGGMVLPCRAAVCRSSPSRSFFRLLFHAVSSVVLGFSYRLRSLSPPSPVMRRTVSLRAFTSPVRRML